MTRGGRAGKKRTQYVRDNSGRFASTPGGGPSKATPASVRKAAKAAAVKGGTLQSRTSLKRSKAKLAAIDKANETLKTTLSRRAQKGAVTRGQKAARAAIKSSQSKLSAAPKLSVIKKQRKSAQLARSSKSSQPVMTPSQVAGQRRRSSERPEARLARAQSRANRQLQELQAKKSSLETAMRRRRGKLSEPDKKAAAIELSKTNRRIAKVKDAQALYGQDIGVANMNRGLTMNYRTGQKAPQNEKTARNRLGTLRRRVSFLKKDEVKLVDKYGKEYDGPKLQEAKKALTNQAISMRGLKVGFRTKTQSIYAQRGRRNLIIKQANATKWTQQGGRSGLYTKRVRRGIVHQGNLLTGGTDRIGGRFRLNSRSR
jgi:hypothetical protein